MHVRPSSLQEPTDLQLIGAKLSVPHRTFFNLRSKSQLNGTRERPIDLTDEPPLKKQKTECAVQETCPICLETNANTTILDCLHKGCNECLTHYLKISRAQPPCPICRTPIKRIHCFTS